MDHFNYTTNLEREDEPREEQFDALDECYDISDNCKYSDALIIDFVRSRPYLYDKTQREYKDTRMKENAWREMASILNMTVSDCQTQWTRLCQRFSKERMLREQETRSGAGKPTRPKWFLFESLTFLERHMVHRKSITNMSISQPSILKMHQGKRINQDFREMTSPKVTNQRLCSQNISRNNVSALERSWTPSPLQQQPQLSSPTIKQVDDDLILASTDISDTQLAPVLPPPSETPLPSQQSIASTQRSNASERSAVSSPQRLITSPSEQSAASSPQQSMSSDSDSEILSAPPTCFMGNQKPVKRQKIDLVENAFSQINTTLSMMASRVYSKKNPTPDDDDPDVLIGKLVTAELKKTLEPKKSVLKKKIMEILYC